MTYYEAVAKFGQSYSCPKCTATDSPTPLYRPYTAYNYPGAGNPTPEHLLWVCPVCEYPTESECADWRTA